MGLLGGWCGPGARGRAQDPAQPSAGEGEVAVAAVHPDLDAQSRSRSGAHRRHQQAGVPPGDDEVVQRPLPACVPRAEEAVADDLADGSGRPAGLFALRGGVRSDSGDDTIVLIIHQSRAAYTGYCQDFA
ncbi:hypothetical protein NORO109296_18485 [Nocardiopsis rhodophaea]